MLCDVALSFRWGRTSKNKLPLVPVGCRRLRSERSASIGHIGGAREACTVLSRYM